MLDSEGKGCGDSSPSARWAARQPPPRGGNRPHWHADFDEWWVVFAGHLEWELTGGVVVQARKDDIVWVPRGTVHHIRNVGDELALRMAVAMPPPSTTTAPASSAATRTTAPANGAPDSPSRAASR